MLAPRELPQSFAAWNNVYRAPVGASWWVRLINSRYVGLYSLEGGPGWLAWKFRSRLPSVIIRSIGPFGFQPNSRTRTYEYPWAFFATPLTTGLDVVELGSGVSGFQFVVASIGANVTSVDPLINPSDAVDWMFSEAECARINRAFGGRVSFVRAFLEDAQVLPNSVDRIYAISVLEHVPERSLPRLMEEIYRCLRPGGYLIATIDLFLDCRPFGSEERNRYGRNVSVKEVVQASGLRMRVGDPAELCGFDEFSAENIENNLGRYLVHNEVMTQCIVLQKFRP